MAKLRRTLNPENPTVGDSVADSLKTNGAAGVPIEGLASVMAVVFAAIDAEPIEPVITWPIKKKRVRIEAVDIDDGVLTFRLVPGLR